MRLDNYCETSETSLSSTSITSITSTSIFLNPINALSLINLNNSGSQLNDLLGNYTSDLSSCLTNCSNQGICVLDSQQRFICECNQYRSGFYCQSDTRPCSSNPCLNRGTCTNIANDTLYECKCDNLLNFGKRCENKFDLCLNSSLCIINQGICQMNETQSFCKCFKDYTGLSCEIMSTSLVIRKAFISVTTIIAIVVMACYVIMILCFDFTKYCVKKNENETKNKQIPLIKRFNYIQRQNEPLDLTF